MRDDSATVDFSGHVLIWTTCRYPQWLWNGGLRLKHADIKKEARW